MSYDEHAVALISVPRRIEMHLRNSEYPYHPRVVWISMLVSIKCEAEYLNRLPRLCVVRTHGIDNAP